MRHICQKLRFGAVCTVGGFFGGAQRTVYGFEFFGALGDFCFQRFVEVLQGFFGKFAGADVGKRKHATILKPRHFAAHPEVHSVAVVVQFRLFGLAAFGNANVAVEQPIVLVRGELAQERFANQFIARTPHHCCSRRIHERNLKVRYHAVAVAHCLDQHHTIQGIIHHTANEFVGFALFALGLFALADV